MSFIVFNNHSVPGYVLFVVSNKNSVGIDIFHARIFWKIVGINDYSNHLKT